MSARYAFIYYLCRLAAIDALDELAMAAPEREWRLIEVDASLADVDRHRRHILGKHAISCYINTSWMQIRVLGY